MITSAVISAGDRTLQLFVEMRQQELQPSVITYSAVISTCGKCGMPERAFQLLDVMQQQGLEPNVITYTPVIWAKGPIWQLSMRCDSRGSYPM